MVMVTPLFRIRMVDGEDEPLARFEHGGVDAGDRDAQTGDCRCCIVWLLPAVNTPMYPPGSVNNDEQRCAGRNIIDGVMWQPDGMVNLRALSLIALPYRLGAIERIARLV